MCKHPYQTSRAAAAIFGAFFFTVTWLQLNCIMCLRPQREMRYGGDDRLYVPSCRIRTRNKQRWVTFQTWRLNDKAKKLFKTPSRQDRCLCNFTDWLWKKSYFPAFFLEYSAHWNEGRICCGNSVDCHHESPSGTFEQNRSSGGNDGRRCRWSRQKWKLWNCILKSQIVVA